MIKEWQQVQGNTQPMSFSVRDDIYAVLTRNVSQVEEDIWQYEEFVMNLDDYNYIINANSINANELSEGIEETYELSSDNALIIEQIETAIIELYELIGGM